MTNDKPQDNLTFVRPADALIMAVGDIALEQLSQDMLTGSSGAGLATVLAPGTEVMCDCGWEGKRLDLVEIPAPPQTTCPRCRGNPDNLFNHGNDWFTCVCGWGGGEDMLVLWKPETPQTVAACPQCRDDPEDTLTLVFDLEAEGLHVRQCALCGCTDEDCSQCIAATGGPCSWVTSKYVQPDVCSRCALEAARTVLALRKLVGKSGQLRIDYVDSPNALRPAKLHRLTWSPYDLKQCRPTSTEHEDLHEAAELLERRLADKTPAQGVFREQFTEGSLTFTPNDTGWSAPTAAGAFIVIFPDNVGPHEWGVRRGTQYATDPSGAAISFKTARDAAVMAVHLWGNLGPC